MNADNRCPFLVLQATACDFQVSCPSFFQIDCSLFVLLHDVGHLPFSHALEDPFEDLLGKRDEILPFQPRSHPTRFINGCRWRLFGSRGEPAMKE
jgi:hypothetical protein